MNDFFSFKKMITPIAIQILFWIGVGACVIMGITMIAASSPFGRATAVVNGLVVLFIGPIAVRVACELIMVVFNIHDRLKEISRFEE
jgi:type IV secretory pathway VirB2 component (pilin)